MKRSDLDLRGETEGQIKTTCPNCSKNRKKPHERCLQVNLDTGGYTCWNCESSGYLEDVRRQRDFAVKPKREYQLPPEEPAADPDPDVVAYFDARGISKQTLAAWRITAGPSFGVYDYDAPKTSDGKAPLKRDEDGIPIYLRGIHFPFLEDGKPVNVKHLRPREWTDDGERRFRSFVGGKPIPFGLDRAKGRIVIVEGEIDALSVYEAGVHEVWSIPNGAKNFEWLSLDVVVDKLLQAGDVYLAGDTDADGRACREELIRRLSQLCGPEKLAVVNWPGDCKDANDTLVKYGPEKVKLCIERDSVPIPIDGISTVDEFIPEYMEFYNEGIPRGVSTGVPSLDPLYRVMPGMFTVVSGITNYGKSELMDEIVRCMIQQHGWKFAFYTPENSPTPLHLIKVAEKYIGKPFDKAKPGAMSKEEALAAAEWMQESFFYINPKNQTYSIDEILDRARILVYRSGIQGLIIDPWNYVRKDFGNLREDQYINEQMQKIGVFTKSTGVHVWLTVHPRTLRKDKDGRIEVPTVMDLSGGSKFGDNADFFFVVHRNPKEAFETGIHKVEVHVQKSRYRYAAIQGNVELEWEPFNGRFKALGEPNICSSAPLPGDGEYDLDEDLLGHQGSTRPEPSYAF